MNVGVNLSLACQGGELATVPRFMSVERGGWGRFALRVA